MNNLKQKLFKFFNNEEKSNLLQRIPNLNEYNLVLSKRKNLILKGGNKETEDYENIYNNIYNNKSGKFYLKINDNKYYYRTDRYSPSNNEIFIDLITLKDEYKNNIHCGSIQIDKSRGIANILSLGNSTLCIESKNPNIKFKYGDIIFQIMIYICKKENIKKIELTDNSNITCANHKLKLSYLKTMTHGLPHYAKYGFIPKDSDDKIIFDQNYQIYLQNPRINKSELINLIKGTTDKKIISQIIKVLNEINEQNISIKKFISMVTTNLENNQFCELANKIYKKLYISAGYKPLLSQDYKLKL